MIKLVNESHIRSSVQKLYEQLRTQIHEVIPEASVEHIGSSAVPGAVTKGDVDVQVEVSRNSFLQARSALDEQFEHNPEMEPMPEFVSYSGTCGGIDFGIQLVCEGEREFDFVRWRDALRLSPELLTSYNLIKQKQASCSVAEYRQAKSDFIEGWLNDI